jgi:uncharacterized protein (TIGR02145 family)
MKKSTAFWLSVKSLLPGQVKKYPGKIKVLNLSIILLSLFLISCQKEMQNLIIPAKSNGNTLKSVTICETPLIAAQNITAGTVTATFNAAGNQLTITYSTINTGYCLTETHLDVEINPANFPQANSGNPKVNQFAYGANLGCETAWTQVVDLNTVSGWSLGDTVFIAANASVKKIPGGKKEAWGQGLAFPGNNWAMYFFCLQPSCGNPFTDSRDGKSYTTVQIGSQCWMAQNLNIGTKTIGSADQTNNSIIEKYCYGDLESNCDVYGGLYQWNEMMQYVTTEGVQGICPTGWHLPTDAEWTTLTTYLGGESVAGGKLKETGTIHWFPNTGATNESGFTAVPAGYRYDYGGTFGFGSIGNYGYWLSSSESSAGSAWTWGVNYGGSSVGRYGYPKYNGFSVRCLKDN